MALTPGKWQVGTHISSTVVSDTVPSDYSSDAGHDHAQYYGGFLLAESIGNQDDAALFAESKEILQLAAQVIREVNRADLSSVRQLEAKIKKFIP